MTVNIRLDWGAAGHSVHQLASNGGRALLHEWARSLPPGTGDPLKRLLDDGEFAGTDALAASVAAARRSHPPAESAVMHTVDDMLALLDGGAGPETAVILDDLS